MPHLRAWVLMTLAAVSAVSAVSAVGGRAHAESAEAQVERLAAEAVNAYRGADYNRAVELLQRAYEIRQVPALLYNIAKAYDKLGEVDHAYETYRRYADSADADPRLKAKADARLAVLEETRRKKAATEHPVEKPQPPPAPPPAVVEAPKPPPPPPPTAEELKERARQDRQRQRRRDRFIAIGLGAGAVALAGVAIGLSVNALQLHDDWSAQYGGDETARRELKNTALSRAAIADGFYAAAAAVAGVGVYFVYRGFRPEPAGPPLLMGVLPFVSPTGGGLVASGRF